MKSRLSIWLILILALLAAGGSRAMVTAARAAPTLSVAPVAGGFNQPTDIANAGDDRLFIVERAGVIRIVDGGGTILPAPFLAITGLVDSTTHGEMGLLGLAFHPNYPATPYFYVNYTARGGGDTVIARYQVSADANVADAASRLELLRINQPQSNHNGGDLSFGPADGYLYIGMGDGGGGGDDDPGHGTRGNGQEMTTLLGKLLRIDVDGLNGRPPDCGQVQGGGQPPYTVPDNNPFVDDNNPDDGRCDEIWAAGLRNPWRFSFDRQSADLFIADVGQGDWEEVNFRPASSPGGENYGWRCYEGAQPFNTTGCSAPSAYIFPFDDYPHSGPNPNDEGYSVTGGFVYRGSSYPALQGYYLYADFGTANVWLALQAAPGNWQETPMGTIAGLTSPSTFGEGCDGELYVASYGGTIFQIQASAAAPGPARALDQFIYLPLLIGGSGQVPPCR